MTKEPKEYDPVMVREMTWLFKMLFNLEEYFGGHLTVSVDDSWSEDEEAKIKLSMTDFEKNFNNAIKLDYTYPELQEKGEWLEKQVNLMCQTFDYDFPYGIFGKEREAVEAEPDGS